MSTPEISRGSDTQVRVFNERTGELVRTWTPNSATFGTDDNKERQKRLGTRRKPIRQTIDGHSGTIVFELEGFELFDLEDQLIERYLGAEEQLRLEIVRRIFNPSLGASRIYRYPGVAFSLNEDIPEQDQAVTVTLTWMSEPRELVQ